MKNPQTAFIVMIIIFISFYARSELKEKQELEDISQIVIGSQESKEALENLPDFVSDSFCKGDLAGAWKEKVVKIITPTSFELESGRKVKMVCIETPKVGEDYYEESKERVSEIILNKEVCLVKGILDTDKSDRWVRDVYVCFTEECTSYNNPAQSLLGMGYAKVSMEYPDGTLCYLFKEVEKNAKEKQIGIWE